MKRYLPILIVFLILVSGAYAVQRKGACKKGDCISGAGAWDYQNGIVYQGLFKAGLFDGQGELTDSDVGARYTGEFENDKPNGRGVLKWADGTTLSGVFKNGTIINGYKLAKNGAKKLIMLSEEEITKLNDMDGNLAERRTNYFGDLFFAPIVIGFIVILVLFKLGFTFFDRVVEERQENKKTALQKLQDKMLFMALFNLRRAGKLRKKDQAAYDSIVDEKKRTIKS